MSIKTRHILKIFNTIGVFVVVLLIYLSQVFVIDTMSMNYEDAESCEYYDTYGNKIYYSEYLFVCPSFEKISDVDGSVQYEINYDFKTYHYYNHDKYWSTDEGHYRIPEVIGYGLITIEYDNTLILEYDLEYTEKYDYYLFDSNYTEISHESMVSGFKYQVIHNYSLEFSSITERIFNVEATPISEFGDDFLYLDFTEKIPEEVNERTFELTSSDNNVMMFDITYNQQFVDESETTEEILNFKMEVEKSSNRSVFHFDYYVDTWTGYLDYVDLIYNNDEVIYTEYYSDYSDYRHSKLFEKEYKKINESLYLHNKNNYWINPRIYQYKNIILHDDSPNDRIIRETDYGYIVRYYQRGSSRHPHKYDHDNNYKYGRLHFIDDINDVTDLGIIQVSQVIKYYNN